MTRQAPQEAAPADDAQVEPPVAPQPRLPRHPLVRLMERVCSCGCPRSLHDSGKGKGAKCSACSCNEFTPVPLMDPGPDGLRVPVMKTVFVRELKQVIRRVRDEIEVPLMRGPPGHQVPVLEKMPDGSFTPVMESRRGPEREVPVTKRLRDESVVPVMARTYVPKLFPVTRPGPDGVPVTRMVARLGEGGLILATKEVQAWVEVPAFRRRMMWAKELGPDGKSVFKKGPDGKRIREPGPFEPAFDVNPECRCGWIDARCPFHTERKGEEKGESPAGPMLCNVHSCASSQPATTGARAKAAWDGNTEDDDDQIGLRHFGEVPLASLVFTLPQELRVYAVGPVLDDLGRAAFDVTRSILLRAANRVEDSNAEIYLRAWVHPEGSKEPGIFKPHVHVIAPLVVLDGNGMAVKNLKFKLPEEWLGADGWICQFWRDRVLHSLLGKLPAGLHSLLRAKAFVVNYGWKSTEAQKRHSTKYCGRTFPSWVGVPTVTSKIRPRRYGLASAPGRPHLDDLIGKLAVTALPPWSACHKCVSEDLPGLERVVGRSGGWNGRSSETGTSTAATADFWTKWSEWADASDEEIEEQRADDLRRRNLKVAEGKAKARAKRESRSPLSGPMGDEGRRAPAVAAAQPP